MVTLKERLRNVGAVLSIAVNPFAKGKIESTIKNPVLKATTEFIANSPYTTAGVIAGGASVIKGGIGKAISALSTKTKVVGSGLALVATPAIIGNPQIATGAIKVVGAVTPENIIATTFQASRLTATPTLQGLKEFASENKLTLGVLAGLGAVVGATKVAPAISNISNIVATNRNTKAINESIEAGKVIPITQAITPVAALPTEIPKGKETPMPSTVPVPTEPITSHII